MPPVGLRKVVGAMGLAAGAGILMGAKALTRHLFHDPWPPFTMVYMDWTRGYGEPRPALAVTSLRYRDTYHWQAEYLFDI